MSVRSGCLLASSPISRKSFCLVVLSRVERRVLKSPTLTAHLSIPSFNSNTFCFTYFAGLLFGVYTFRIAISSW